MSLWLPWLPSLFPTRDVYFFQVKRIDLYIAHAYSLKYAVFLLDASLPSIIYVFLKKLVGAQVVLVAAEQASLFASSVLFL